MKNKRKPTATQTVPFRRIEARCAVSTLHDDGSDAGDVDFERYSSVDDSNDGVDATLLDNDAVGLSVFADVPRTSQENDSSDTTDHPYFGADGAVETWMDSSAGTPRPQSTPTRCSPTVLISSPLTATSRAGLTPPQLAQLSSNLAGVNANQEIGPSVDLLSQTAQRRIRLDKMMDKLTSESATPARATDSGLVSLLMMMDERQAARDADLRREREERESRREERERQFRLEMARSQSPREIQNQQMMMLMMAKVFGVQPVENPSEE